MFYQSSLLVMLLMPVVIYLAGALVFSLFQSARQRSTLAESYHKIYYQNGL